MKNTIMPTGYTAEIKDGISFEKFVLNCARAFGALIMMRDEPHDAPIPEFKPSEHHKEELKKAKDELKVFTRLTDDQLKAMWEQDFITEYNSWEKYEDEKVELRSKYSEMLANVVKWQPPTKDHYGLKEFMIKQIRESIDFDCSPYEPPVKLSQEEWYKKKREKLQWSIEYHTKQNAEEIRRTNERNEWVNALRDSLTSTELEIKL